MFHKENNPTTVFWGVAVVIFWWQDTKQHPIIPNGLQMPLISSDEYIIIYIIIYYIYESYQPKFYSDQWIQMEHPHRRWPSPSE